MNRGYIHLWRKIEDSAVFQNEGLLKVFLWCIVSATHKEIFIRVKTGRGSTEVKLLPGTFLFGRESAAKKLHMSPSTVWKRILKLKKLEILNIESNTHYSIIHIINWPTYQADNSEGNSEGDRQGTAKEHKQEHKNIINIKTPPENIFSEISELENRYQDHQQVITQVFQAISSTRKSNRLADSVRLSILQSWGKYPISQVMEGIRKYLDRQYYQQGKGEKYLLGIIRNGTPPQEYKGAGPVFESSGSPLLDKVRRGEIRPVVRDQA